MEKQISIIIPTYNMENYIGKCLDSLLIPELEAVEVLVVNDGSKDRSSEIAHSYADRYPGSIRVIDKPNGNYGSCINAALPVASGRYVKVLDADDTFDSAEFSKLVQMLPTVDVDVIFTQCQVVDEQGNFLEVTGFAKDKVNIDTIYTNVQEVLSTSILMHWITYNRRVFTKLDYHQPEGISYTDNIWSFVPLAFCKTGLFKNWIIYRYLVGRSGQTVGVEQMKKSINHFAIVATTMVDYYLKISREEELKSIITKNCLGIVTYVYNLIMRFKSVDTLKILQSIDEDIKERAPEIYILIGEYNIYKSINYKIYKHLRESGYSPSFTVPANIRFRFRNTLRFEALKKRIKNKIFQLS